MAKTIKEQVDEIIVALGEVRFTEIVREELEYREQMAAWRRLMEGTSVKFGTAPNVQFNVKIGPEADEPLIIGD